MSLLPTPHGSEALHAIQMEVEEVNPSPKLTTPKQSSTKESFLKKTISVASQEKEEFVECNHKWVPTPGVPYEETCVKCGVDRYV